MDSSEQKKRTKQFGLRVVHSVETLPNNRTSNVIGHQLLRSGTSVGANYRAACRAKSKADFAAKASIAIEEADESLYWMELLTEGGIISEERLSFLMQESNELIAILTASVKTVRRNLRNNRSSPDR